MENQVADKRLQNYNNLFNKMREASPNENFVFSPASIFLALGLITEGLSPDAKSQISEIMGYGSPMVIENKRFDAMQSNLRDAFRKDYKIACSNSVWYSRHSTVNAGFEGLVYYKWASRIAEVDFTSDETVKEINDDIEMSTDGLVKDFLKEIDPLTVLILINTVYFEGKWMNQFQTDRNKEQEFNNSDGSKTVTTFMNMSKNVNYHSDSTHHYFKLPYQGVPAFLLIALPKEDATTEPDFSVIANNMELMKETPKCNISLPKFKIQKEMSIKLVLTKLGVTELFKENAVVPGIIEDADAKLSDIIHSAVIEVNEAGTKAAAVTAVFLKTKSKQTQPPIDLVCDKPFNFYLMFDNGEEGGDHLLFAGKHNTAN